MAAVGTFGLPQRGGEAEGAEMKWFPGCGLITTDGITWSFMPFELEGFDALMGMD
jgi:hypothetical protein